MSEIYFTPNPNNSSRMGLLEVPLSGEEPTHHNAAHADFIARAIGASNTDDPQARVMEAFYRGDGIPRELLDHMEPTIKALDVAELLRGSLYDLVEADATSASFTTQGLEALSRILETRAREDINYLNRDGLLVDVDSGGFSAPSLNSTLEPLRLEEDEREVAIQLETPVYAYQMELVWRSGETGGPQPVLLSRRQHTALGHIAADGSFNHVATVLADDHPARKPFEG